MGNLITLEFDEETNEFKIFAMHNFENQDELQVSGKRFPLRGKLRTISSYYTTLFGYISDDTTFVFVELRTAVKIPDLTKTYSMANQSVLEEQKPKKYNKQYLNAWGQDVESYFKVASFNNLWERKIHAIIDIELIEMNQQQIYLYVLHQSEFDKSIATVSRQNISKVSIFEFIQENNETTALSYVYTVDYISYYARNIVKAFPDDDFAYVVSGPGLYVLRQEKKRFSYIQTSSMAGLIDNVNSTHYNPEKNVQTNENFSVKNIIDCKNTEIRFDGCTRCAYIEDDNIIRLFVSSYYNNQHYYEIISKVKEEPADQRQKIDDNIGYYMHKKELIYDMAVVDSLVTISPVTDVIPLQGNDLDFICISGYQTRSYMTFVREFFPYDSILIKENQGIKKVFTIRDKKQVGSIDSFVVVSLEQQTQVMVPIKAGVFEELDSLKSDFELKEQTICCLSVGVSSPQKIIQITPTKILLLNMEGKLISKVEFKEDEGTICGIGKEQLEFSDLIFIFHSKQGIICYNCSDIRERMIKHTRKFLEIEGQQITAFSTSCIPNQDEYLIVAYQPKAVIRIYKIDELTDSLSKEYEVRHATEQWPFLPNQLEGRQLELMLRSTTDLSVELVEFFHTSEIHKEKVYITELHLKQIDQKLVLLLILSNGKIMVYENITYFQNFKKEKFRFKIVEAQVLRKYIDPEKRKDQQYQADIMPQQIHIDGNQIIVLDETNPFILNERKGQLLFHKLRPNVISFLAPYKQSKQSNQTLYIYVNSNLNTLNIMKVPLIFDPKISPQFVDSFLIKQVVFENKTIKKATLFTSNNIPPSGIPQKYIIATLFSNNKQEVMQTQNQEEQKSQANYYDYELYAFQVPGNNWKMYTAAFEQNYVIKQSFKPDEIVLCLEEVKLKLMSGQEKNFIAISTIKLDSQMLEEGFYNSFLQIYDIEQDKRFKLECLEAFKGTITCLNYFQGQIVAVNKTQRLKDLAIVFYKFNDKNFKFDAQIQPQSIETLGLSISFDGDYVFVGDAYKNIRVLWLSDQEELKRKERLQDVEGIISLKKLYSNTLDTQIVGIYSLRGAERNDYVKMNQAERQALTLITASEDGYIRLQGLREKKLLESIAQINIQDKILKIIPIPLNPQKAFANQKRKFMVIPQRGGILIATTISEQEYLGLSTLTKQFTLTLPHRGGVTPLFALKKPFVPKYKIDPIVERMNQEAVDKRALRQFYYMFNNLQKKLAEQIGYSDRTITNYFAESN